MRMYVYAHAFIFGEACNLPHDIACRTVRYLIKAISINKQK